MRAPIARTLPFILVYSLIVTSGAGTPALPDEHESEPESLTVAVVSSNSVFCDPYANLKHFEARLLKTLCPSMGKGKIAQMLCRAGLHLGTTTVGRMLKEKPEPASSPSEDAPSDGRVVTAKRPDHVWHVDLTTVPIGGGFWCSWLPFALPQSWPF